LSLKVGFGWQFGKTCLEARSPDDPLDLKKMVAEEKAEKHKAVKNAPTGKK